MESKILIEVTTTVTRQIEFFVSEDSLEDRKLLDLGLMVVEDINSRAMDAEDTWGREVNYKDYVEAKLISIKKEEPKPYLFGGVGPKESEIE